MEYCVQKIVEMLTNHVSNVLGTEVNIKNFRCYSLSKELGRCVFILAMVSCKAENNWLLLAFFGAKTIFPGIEA